MKKALEFYSLLHYLEKQLKKKAKYDRIKIR